MTEYNSSAWEDHPLPEFYKQVGWAINRRHTVSLVLMLDHERMLDIGCLDAAYIQRLRQSGYTKKYLGIDVTNKYVEDCRKKLPNEEFKQGDARQLEIEDRSFDLVLFSDVIQHLDSHQQALSEACRVSSKYVILSTYGTPESTFTTHSAKFLNTYFSKEDFEKLFPPDFKILLFADLPHPTTKHRSKKIFHYVLERINENNK